MMMTTTTRKTNENEIKQICIVLSTFFIKMTIYEKKKVE